MLIILPIEQETKTALYHQSYSLDRCKSVKLLLDENTDKTYVCVEEMEVFAGDAGSGFVTYALNPFNYTIQLIQDINGNNFQYKEVKEVQPSAISIQKDTVVEQFVIYTYDTVLDRMHASAKFIRLE